MLLLVSAFLAGVALVIVVEVFIVYRWFRSLPNEEPKLFPVHKPVTNPKVYIRFMYEILGVSLCIYEEMIH